MFFIDQNNLLQSNPIICANLEGSIHLALDEFTKQAAEV